MLRHLTIALVATGIVLTGMTAQAGTITEKTTYRGQALEVRYKLRLHGLEGMRRVISTRMQRHRAIARAKKLADQRIEDAVAGAVNKLLYYKALIAMPYFGPGSLTYWMAINPCEEGPGTDQWATNTSTFVGGLGFMRETWDSAAPRVGLPTAPGEGTPFPFTPIQQAVVANEVIAMNGSAYPAETCSTGHWGGW